MWITSDVELPEALVAAQAAGELVLFVGAGASVDDPSGLPSFVDLARDLAERAAVPWPQEDEEGRHIPIDSFLGALPPDFETHRHAEALIDVEGSLPNATHAALVRVASAPGPMRIVTTNFDRHLSAAAGHRSVEVPNLWSGPALPLGGEFSGIVHLHGAIRRTPRQIVLTDHDLGRAYLTEGWATRFLLSLFNRFTVLFVGYSHDDPMMKYLALGLPSGGSRFALTTEQDAALGKWSRLGIQPVAYPLRGGSHTALVVALDAWATRSKMGRTDHRARIHDIVAGGPPLSPEDRDYVLERLRVVDGARDFVAAVSSRATTGQRAWLQWLETAPSFEGGFRGVAATDDGAAVLMHWFCQSFIEDSALHEAGLNAVLHLGHDFRDDLYDAALWSTHKLAETNETSAGRWRMLLATSLGRAAPRRAGHLALRPRGAPPPCASSLRAMLRPFLRLREAFRLAPNEPDGLTLPDAEVGWSVEEYALSESIQEAIAGAKPGDPALGNVLEGALHASYDLLDAYFVDRGWDQLSLRRSAIGEDARDSYRRPIDAVIDGLRTHGERALPLDPRLPERWWSTERDLFRRLALHLVAIDRRRSPDEKLQWLVERSLPADHGLKHEVFAVLAGAYGLASQSSRDRLLGHVMRGPDDYERYNVLVWLRTVAPDCSEVRAAHEEAETAHPEFAPRDHPDFNSWVDVGVWGGSRPLAPEDLIEALDDEDWPIVAKLLDDPYDGAHGLPEWYDAIDVVRVTAETRPELGLALIEFVDWRSMDDGRRGEVRRCVVEGWTRADTGPRINEVLALVSAEAARVESARAITRFLAEQVRARVGEAECPETSRMRSIAQSVWQAHGDSFESSGDPLSFAPLYLNSWPGDLAEYWLLEIDRRWRTVRGSVTGLDDPEREAIESLLSGPADALSAILPVLTGSLAFLFEVDEEFTSASVLPHFRPGPTAPLAWFSFLNRPRYTDRILEAGLLASSREAWDWIGTPSFDPDRTRQFYRFVSSILSFAGVSPGQRRDLLANSVKGADGAHATAFAQTVVDFLRSDDVDGAAVWELWLGDHISRRLDGLPRVASADELAAWADAVPLLGICIAAGADLLKGHGIGFGERVSVPDIELVFDEIADFVAERVSNSSPETSPQIGFHVDRLLQSGRTSLGDVRAEALVEAARDAGFVD